MENVIEDFDSFIDFEIEERLLDELDELIEKEMFPKEYEEYRKY